MDEAVQKDGEKMIINYLCTLVKIIGSIPVVHLAQTGQTLYIVRTDRRKNVKQDNKYNCHPGNNDGTRISSGWCSNNARR